MKKKFLLILPRSSYQVITIYALTTTYVWVSMPIYTETMHLNSQCVFSEQYRRVDQ